MPDDRPGPDERWCFRCEAIVARDETTCPECGAALRPYATTHEDYRRAGPTERPDGHRTTSIDGWSRPSPRTVATGIGALAFGIGYLAMWLVSSLTLSSLPITFGGIGDPVPTWKAVGWVFYRAHNAMIDGLGFSVTGVVFAEAGTRSYAGTLITSPIVFLVPPLVLLLAGYASTRWTGRGVSPSRQGASIVRGYLPLAVAGVLLTISTEHLCLFVYPEPVTSVGLVGLTYPVVFGAIGGVLASRGGPNEASNRGQTPEAIADSEG